MEVEVAADIKLSPADNSLGSWWISAPILENFYPTFFNFSFIFDKFLTHYPSAPGFHQNLSKPILREFQYRERTIHYAPNFCPILFIGVNLEIYAKIIANRLRLGLK